MKQPYTYRILAEAIKVDEVCAKQSYTFPVERRIIYAWPGLSDWYEQMIESHCKGEIPEAGNIYMTLDHMLPIKNKSQADFIEKSRKWAMKKGMNISENEGIGHILAIEKGWVKPGMIVPHLDTHVACIGAIGALGLGLLKEMVYPLATNKLWLEIPEVVRINLTGKLKPGVTGRDLLHMMIDTVGLNVTGGRIIEYGGPSAMKMELDDRITICNLSNYLAAVSGLFDVSMETDLDKSAYSYVIDINLCDVVPYIAAPSAISNVHPLADYKDEPIDLGIIGTCSGGGLNDLKLAAQILQGRQIKEGCKLFVVPSTNRIYEEAINLGYIQTLIEAKCFISSPTCDFCYGSGVYLQAGQTAISTQTLNTAGRLGSIEGNIYLASSAAVAASLIEGKIADPVPYLEEQYDH